MSHTAEDLGLLATEASDPRFANLDTLSVAELAILMNTADHTVSYAVAAAFTTIVPAIEAASERMAGGGRLIYVGAGTAGRMGVLDASECPPTFNTPPDRVFAIMAGGPTAIESPVEGAEDDAEAGAAAIDRVQVEPQDTVIGIASSGRTPFVVAAVARARSRGALTIGLSCNIDTLLSDTAEHGIEVNVGPEVLAGSTRLKSGTAQKLVLNMFSTIVMVRQGKAYGNLMVDLKPSNHKLRERATRIVASIAHVTPKAARAALEASGYDVKIACVTLVRGDDLAAATQRLEKTGGYLRRALEED